MESGTGGIFWIGDMSLFFLLMIVHDVLPRTTRKGNFVFWSGGESDGYELYDV
jgi:hypothetical protein